MKHWPLMVANIDWPCGTQAQHRGIYSWALSQYKDGLSMYGIPIIKIRRSSHCLFLHTKPWIPGGEKSIFTVVIHLWRSPLHQFMRARTIEEYDVTMSFTWRHKLTVVMSQCYVKKDRPWWQWRNERSIIVFSGVVFSGHKIGCKNWNNAFVTLNNNFLSLVMWFANDFHTWLRHLWKSFANHLTRDQKSLFTCSR